MSKVWFTSDTHFTHEKLLEFYPERHAISDFTGDVRVFDRNMIERWNDQVAHNDTVYHIGDFGFGPVENSVRTLRRLHGKIHFVPGNHDRKLVNNEEFARQLTTLHPYSYAEISVEGQQIVLCHFPIWEWAKMNRGSWHIHGHCHGKPTGIPGKIMDVGVDGNELKLYSYDDVRRYMDARAIRTHH